MSDQFDELVLDDSHKEYLRYYPMFRKDSTGRFDHIRKEVGFADFFADWHVELLDRLYAPGESIRIDEPKSLLWAYREEGPCKPLKLRVGNTVRLFYNQVKPSDSLNWYEAFPTPPPKGPTLWQFLLALLCFVVLSVSLVLAMRWLNTKPFAPQYEATIDTSSSDDLTQQVFDHLTLLTGPERISAEEIYLEHPLPVVKVDDYNAPSLLLVHRGGYVHSYGLCGTDWTWPKGSGQMPPLEAILYGYGPLQARTSASHIRAEVGAPVYWLPQGEVRKLKSVLVELFEAGKLPRN